MLNLHGWGGDRCNVTFFKVVSFLPAINQPTGRIDFKEVCAILAIDKIESLGIKAASHCANPPHEI
jgi:hypothetical protein